MAREDEHERKLAREEEAELRRASARLRHESEQAGAGLRHVGEMLGSMYAGLTSSGVPRRHAVEIINSYVSATMYVQNMKRPGDEP